MTHYERLGISPKATISEIKRAYRIKAKELHPDINHSKEANEKMVKLNEAYQVLSDPIARVAYDITLNPSTQKTYRQKQSSYTSSCNQYKTNQSASHESPPKNNNTSTNTKQNSGSKFKQTIAWIAFVLVISVLFHLGGNSSNNTTTVAGLNYVPSPTPTPQSFIPIYTPAPQQFYYQPALPTTPPEPTVDCIGPDGKHLYVTQKECDNFNNAWRPTPTPTPQQSYNYDWGSCSSTCGANSHCSFGSCVCDDGYAMNYNYNQCEKVVCPQNSTYQYGSCLCNSGYQKNYTTNACDPCPANSTGSYGTCTCNTGYKKNYTTGQCDVLNCPANSTPQAGYCACNSGYYMDYSTNTCVPSQ